MRNTKNAFTLVELIVVITILAILGTIAFISLQGYSADARNSKRTSDIGNIQSAISLKAVEGVPLLSFVSDSTSSLSWVALAGSTSADATKYNAGIPSYTVLNVVEKDFKDPKSDKAYRIGVTEERGGVFQVAATMEEDGTDTAAVNGTFVQRLNSSTGTISSIDGATVTVSDSEANFYKVGDLINTFHTGSAVAADAAKEITKVSRDWVTLTLASDTAITSTGTIHLSVDESAGLIDAGGATSGVVTDLGTTNLAY